MDPLQALRQGLIMFFLAFPMIMITLIGFFSLGLGNLGLFLLFIGHAVIVPVATVISNVVGYFLRQRVPASDINQLVPSVPHTQPEYTVFPSYWVAHTTFFFFYLFWNALMLYRLEPTTETADDDWRVDNRKSRASMIMLSSMFFLIFMIVLRYVITDAERLPGILVGLGLFGGLAYGWQRMTEQAGAKASDVFGIAQQMVPIVENPNLTFCVPRA